MSMTRRHFLGTLCGCAGMTLLGFPLSGRSGQRLVMHYGDNIEPLSYKKNNTMHGLLIELMNGSLRDRMGLAVDHRGFPWARAQSLVAAGEGDGLCTNPTRARKQYAVFSRSPALTIHFDLFYNLAHPRREEIEFIRTLHDLKTFRIVDFKGNNLAKSVYRNDFNVFWANDPETIMKTLKELRQDVYIGNPLYATKLIREMGLANIIGRRRVEIMPPSNYHLGIRNNFDGAGRILNQFDQVISDMERDGTIASIKTPYLDPTYR